jgi:hypothetical protein
MTTTATSPPAGWYPDTQRGVGLRYWNGALWTEARRDSLPPDPKHRLPARTSVLLILLAASILALTGVAAQASGMSAMAPFYVPVAAVIYFLPTIITVRGKHQNAGPVAVVNIFLGWTVLGWIVALAMASTRPKP